MSELDIKSIQTDIATQFEEMKKHVEAAAKKEAGSVSAEVTQKIDKMNDSITVLQDQLVKAEKLLAQSKARSAAAGALEEAGGELKDAWINFIRKGVDNMNAEQKHLMSTHTKALNSASDPSGGYLVLPYFDTEITKRLYETSPMRQVATTKTISTDQYEKPTQLDLAAAYWQDRDHDFNETATQTWGRLTIRVHKLVASPKVSQDLLDDSYVDVESELLDSISQAMDLLENTAFVNGTGVGQPRGLLTYAAGTTWGQIQQFASGAANDITPDALTDLTYGLNAGYRANGRYLMNNLTLAKLRKIVDGEGRALWTPQFGSEPSTINGYPVTIFADMPDPVTGALSVAFGDMRRAYIVVDRAGTRVLRDPYTNAPYVRFTTTRRVGGGVDNFESVKLLKIGETL